MNSLSLLVRGAGLWRRSALLFAEKLSSRLGDRLVLVAALEDEEPLVYESNILVVVKDRNEEVVSEVLRAKREVEKELGERVTISPLITTPDDPAIEAFLEEASLVKRFERREGH